MCHNLSVIIGVTTKPTESDALEQYEMQSAYKMIDQGFISGGQYRIRTYHLHNVNVAL